MSSKKIAKTNAARLLERLEIPFTLHQADVDESDLSAVTMAHKLGVDPGCVFKTLVARGDKTGVIMACIPAAAELNLKALATASGNKHVEMVHLKEVLPLTGYIRGGCTAIGMKKQYVTRIDESAKTQEQIYVSGGRIGSQIQLKPDDLAKAARAEFADIIRHEN